MKIFIAVLFTPLALFALSFLTPSIDAKVSAEFGKNLQDERTKNIGASVEPCLGGDLWRLNYKTCVLANMPLSVRPKNADFRTYAIGDDGAPKATAGLSKASLGFDTQSLSIKTYHHEINSPLLSTNSKDLMPSLVEGVTLKLKSKRSELVLGGYSRISGKGSSLKDRARFETITDSLENRQNTTDNYLVMAGLNLEDKEMRLGSSVYYYQMLPHYFISQDGLETKGSQKYLYGDVHWGLKLAKHSKTMINNRLTTQNNYNFWVFSMQYMRLSGAFDEQTNIFGARVIYKYSALPIMYALALNTADFKGAGVKYPFGEANEYTQTNDFYLNSLNKPDYSLKVQTKFYVKKTVLDLYLAYFNGKESKEAQDLNKALIYGAGLSFKAGQNFWLDLYAQRQDFTLGSKSAGGLATAFKIGLAY